MTVPFTTVVPREDTGDRIYLPWTRAKGKLLIVRPLEYRKEGYITTHAPEGTDVAFCDVALLDAIRPATDEDDNDLPGFDAGTQFRNQSCLAGYLKGTFKRYIGQTLIGTIYKGVATKGKPPLMWEDLSGNAECVERGQQFLIAHPEFLIPVEATFAEAAPEIIDQGPRYTSPARPTKESVYTQHQPGKGPAQNTLDQMRAMAKANGADQDPPF